MVHRLEVVLVCHGCSCADRRRKTALQLLWKTATLLSSCSLIHAKSQQLGCSHERGVSIMTYMSAWLRMSSAFSKSDSGGGQTNGRTRERSVRGGSSSTFEEGCGGSSSFAFYRHVTAAIGDRAVGLSKEDLAITNSSHFDQPLHRMTSSRLHF